MLRFVFFLAPPAAPAVDVAGASLDDLARLLGDGMDERPGSFIAYVGSLASSRHVQDALAAFQSIANLPAHGLATPAYMQGVTVSDRAGWGPSGGGMPALVLTDTSFTRFPYRHAADMPTGAAAAAGTDLGTPWAEKTTGRSSGTSSNSSTKIAPRSRRRSTTKRLWTISWRT